ncbi:MAG: ribosome biogenesis GTPase Der [Candidatus Hydrogenedentes bacterium CG07_land_8_20_14_0_80_42_17]|nr:MAG: ribosome biogenesis GTPase Der [Candidatus Hydrogenedentes bacterium CG1_02_42_14]PIU47554.1 MAG: ribosome biogenesis GTPase Der [Candidatus Hydrogenedentes bacterium CG07_land_8_20_14_0_80_42_17]
MKTISIIGRPNVGKSRLFNRIIGHRKSIVDDCPGVTRDRLEETIDYDGKIIRWVDTGGIGVEDEFGEMITLQAEVAISISDVIIFVVDGRDGLLPADKVIANQIRGKKPIIVAVNKIDLTKLESLWTDFSSLGFEKIIGISAEHGRNVYELMEDAVKLAGENQEEESRTVSTKFAIIGRPNVGKSSLMNTILGEERVIVSEIPGTTRDAIEAMIPLENGNLVLIDTAGIRKNRTSYTKLESVMVGRAKKAVESADVAIIVADAVEGVTEQDIKIVDATLQLGKGAVIALNKWDSFKQLNPDVEEKYDDVIDTIRYKLGSESHVPIVSISALKRLRIKKLLETALAVGENSRRHIRTSELNKILADSFERAPKGIRIKYGIQKSIAPPSFIIFGSKNIPAALARYIISSIRKSGGYIGVPIVLEFRR